MSGAALIAHAAVIAGTSARVATQAPKLAIEMGQQGLTQVKANASGRPGPRVITGNYRGSWNLRIERAGPTEGRVVIGSNAPQGPRLEYGFFGADVLGRHYQQPPFPHVRPMAQVVGPLFGARMTKLGASAVLG